MQSIKCVTVGDGGVGKSCMLISFVHGRIPGEYIPTVFDNMTKNVKFNERPIRLELWDTAGQEGYDRLRPLSYTNTDVFLLCFSIVSPSSFKNIQLKWLKEIRHFCFFAKIILVGTKFDLRQVQENENGKPITRSQGMALAKKIKAFDYVECSAFSKNSLSDVFNAAVKSVLSAAATDNSSMAKTQWCSVL